jgi:hypothetical protein
VLRSEARKVGGRYSSEEIYSTERESVEREILDETRAAIAGKPVELEAILIRDVDLPDTSSARSARSSRKSRSCSSGRHRGDRELSQSAHGQDRGDRRGQGRLAAHFGRQLTGSRRPSGGWTAELLPCAPGR